MHGNLLSEIKMSKSLVMAYEKSNLILVLTVTACDFMHTAYHAGGFFIHNIAIGLSMEKSEIFDKNVQKVDIF